MVAPSLRSEYLVADRTARTAGPGVSRQAIEASSGVGGSAVVCEVSWASAEHVKPQAVVLLGFAHAFHTDPSGRCGGSCVGWPGHGKHLIQSLGECPLGQCPPRFGGI